MVKKLILASSSPRRVQLLNQIGINPTVVAANVDETIPPSMPPADVAVYLATKKATAVAATIRDKNVVVLAADTLVVLDGQMLGKPDSPKHAKVMLRQLSGASHEVITGVTVINPQNSEVRELAVATSVVMGELTDQEIESYVASGEPLDKAGAYALQGYAAAFITSIHGDYTNVVGLPLPTVYELLKDFDLIR